MQNFHLSKTARIRAILFSFLCLPSALLAQSTGGAQISGSITDQSAAVVSSAQVKVTQTDTGQVRTTVSSDSGSYTFPNLPVGPYTVEVVAQGFERYLQSGIVLAVGNAVEINIALQVGNVSQEVHVSAQAGLVQTQDTSISELVDKQRIVDLPLNGRQATQLILLSGGSSNSPAYATGGSLALVTTKTYSGSVAISVAGAQATGNNFLMDGGDNIDAFSNVNLPFPFPDALQEFNVQTSGLSAQYGLHPGAAVNIVTKSGTNHFHGNLFEFLRNGDFNARNYFAAAQDTLHRNQFGGTVGGPIRTDKLFGFFGYQNTIQRTAPPQTISFVPTAAELSGDFNARESAACQSNGKARTIINPQTGKAYANNFVSPSSFSPQALNLLKYIPVSSDPCGKITYGIPTPSNETQYIGRFDWTRSVKDALFVRYFIVNLNNPPYFNGTNALTTTSPGTAQRSQSVVIGDTYTLSTSLVNSVHLTGSRFRDNRDMASNYFSPPSVGINIASFVPNFTSISISSAFSFGSGNGAPAHFNRNTFQFADDATLIRGHQQITFGVDYIYRQLNEFNVFNGNGSFSFNGQFTTDPLLDFILGTPNSLVQGNPEQTGVRQNYIALYAQDNVQLNPKLNIHVGLRWEPFLPETDVAGRGAYFSQSAFNSGAKTSKYTNAPTGLLFAGDPGVPSSYINGKMANFSPRIGLVFDPTGKGKQSIRASYNVFHDTPNLYFYAKWSDSAPWGSTVTLTPPGTLGNLYSVYPGGNPFPFPFPPSASQPFPTNGTYYSFPVQTRATYAQVWGLSYQRQLGGDWLLSADYLGSKTTHLWSGIDQNHAVYIPGNCGAAACSTLTNTTQRRLLYLQNPTTGTAYGQVQSLDEGNYSNYNGLILKARHRFAQNYTLLTSYTYSKCLQDGEVESNDLGNNGPSFQNPYNRNADYGLCDSDLRHSFVGSLVIDSPKFGNKFAQAALGNWEISPIVSAQAGYPFNPVSGVDNSRTSIGQDRPNLSGNPYLRSKSTLKWLNASAYSQNAVGTFGNSGWNSVTTPRYVDLDAAVARTFPIREAINFQFRFEAFNALNHTNLGQPASNLSTSTFGTILSSNPARILQLAAKFTF
jgi:Carboxypeptidase regulatory-like domain